MNQVLDRWADGIMQARLAASEPWAGIPPRAVVELADEVRRLSKDEDSQGDPELLRKCLDDARVQIARLREDYAAAQEALGAIEDENEALWKENQELRKNSDLGALVQRMQVWSCLECLPGGHWRCRGMAYQWEHTRHTPEAALAAALNYSETPNSCEEDDDVD